VSWYRFSHPQLGEVELGGFDDFNLITNPPTALLRQEVEGHAAFAVYQASLSPKLEILYTKVDCLGRHQPANSTGGGGTPEEFVWRVSVGVANTGFLPTNVTVHADNVKAVLPVYVELLAPAIDGSSKPSIRMQDGFSPSRVTVGQLAGRLSTRVDHTGNDGTPDRALSTWLIVAKKGETILAKAGHQRAGKASVSIKLE
jgi:hypothetical protein